jgi:hypothetical protein
MKESAASKKITPSLSSSIKSWLSNLNNLLKPNKYSRDKSPTTSKNSTVIESEFDGKSNKSLSKNMIMDESDVYKNSLIVAGINPLDQDPAKSSNIEPHSSRPQPRHPRPKSAYSANPRPISGYPAMYGGQINNYSGTYEKKRSARGLPRSATEKFSSFSPTERDEFLNGFVGISTIKQLVSEPEILGRGRRISNREPVSSCSNSRLSSIDLDDVLSGV